MLSVFYQNVRGLRTKTSEVKMGLLAPQYHVYCLTETWLNSGFLDSELAGGNMLIFRKDRDYLLSGTSRGGGLSYCGGLENDSSKALQYGIGLRLFGGCVD